MELTTAPDAKRPPSPSAATSARSRVSGPPPPDSGRWCADPRAPAPCQRSAPTDVRPRRRRHCRRDGLRDRHLDGKRVPTLGQLGCHSSQRVRVAPDECRYADLAARLSAPWTEAVTDPVTASRAALMAVNRNDGPTRQRNPRSQASPAARNPRRVPRCLIDQNDSRCCRLEMAAAS